MRGPAVIATSAVLTLVLAASAGARDASGHRAARECMPARAHLNLGQGDIRVYHLGTGIPVTYYACREGRRGRLRLGIRGDCANGLNIPAESFRIRKGRVAFTYDRCPNNGERAGFKLIDVGTRRVVHRYERSGILILDLEVGWHADVAWLQADGIGLGNSVHLADAAAADTVLDSGFDVQARTLALATNGEEVYWRNGLELRTAYIP